MQIHEFSSIHLRLTSSARKYSGAARERQFILPKIFGSRTLRVNNLISELDSIMPKATRPARSASRPARFRETENGSPSAPENPTTRVPPAVPSTSATYSPGDQPSMGAMMDLFTRMNERLGRIEVGVIQQPPAPEQPELEDAHIAGEVAPGSSSADEDPSSPDYALTVSYHS